MPVKDRIARAGAAASLLILAVTACGRTLEDQPSAVQPPRVALRLGRRLGHLRRAREQRWFRGSTATGSSDAWRVLNDLRPDLLPSILVAASDLTLASLMSE